MSDFITHDELVRIEAERLCDENVKLWQLVADCHALLQRVCDCQDDLGNDCPLWPDHGGECDLRKVEQRMRDLGMKVEQ